MRWASLSFLFQCVAHYSYSPGEDDPPGMVRAMARLKRKRRPGWIGGRRRLKLNKLQAVGELACGLTRRGRFNCNGRSGQELQTDLFLLPPDSESDSYVRWRIHTQALTPGYSTRTCTYYFLPDTTASSSSSRPNNFWYPPGGSIISLCFFFFN